MPTKELHEYRQFTTPAELHKAVNTLKGLVAGITTDTTTSSGEIQELLHWCALHEHLRNRHPFNELLPLIDAANMDGVITEDEAQDIVWLCNNFVSDADYYDLIASSIQFLSGLIHGIMADGKLEDREITALSAWINVNEYLKGCYPFDEIESLVMACLADGKIDESERNMLMAYFGNFVDTAASYNIHETELAQLRSQYSIDGICSICPDISFEGKNFCITGELHDCTRKEAFAKIEDAGGRTANNVTKKTDHLVVGASGNPCWAYACYGRKIEQVVSLRKASHKILIVHESDFWDALADM